MYIKTFDTYTRSGKLETNTNTFPRAIMYGNYDQKMKWHAYVRLSYGDLRSGNSFCGKHIAGRGNGNHCKNKKRL
ncbi:hypothetical protein UNDYM_1566 [Undibacterium sp. YM2]|nr:hypothetical protein UNDYM_1566 [Undibacterium sp. YM2]